MYLWTHCRRQVPWLTKMFIHPLLPAGARRDLQVPLSTVGTCLNSVTCYSLNYEFLFTDSTDAHNVICSFLEDKGDSSHQMFSLWTVSQDEQDSSHLMFSYLDSLFYEDYTIVLFHFRFVRLFIVSVPWYT